ncbi:hypothetical protein MMC11_008470 [Xylographa trunciseda]|nr:hypothetical protein [Xylographa trunciseda]
MTGFFGRSRESDNTVVLKNQLNRLLNDVDDNASGSFATSGLLANTYDPKLFVHGLGKISLPLSDQDAVALREICQQSPCGMGSETIIDTAVRKSWQLNPNHFDIRSAAWQACVGEALERLGKELGIVGGKKSIRAEIYKLLLYEEGSFFVRHRDSEKAPGMFGTLVICLPACHTGGEVEASFGGRQRILKTADTSDFGYTYLAWYADVEHAVKPLTSGYRLALTYNLIFTAPGLNQSASSSARKKLELENLLSSWKRILATAGSEGPKLLAYMTEHKYTDANLHFDYLKGKDRYRAQYLKDTSGKQEFFLFLANLEYTVSGGCAYEDHRRFSGRNYRGDDYDDDRYDSEDYHRPTLDYHKLEEITSSELKLRIVVQAKGVMVVKDVPMPENYVVQQGAFEGIPEQEEYFEYTGNEGVSATHYYRNSCLVVIPRACLIDVLFEPAKKGDEDLYSWFYTLLFRGRVNSDDEQRMNDLVNLCTMVIDWTQIRRAEEAKQNKLEPRDKRAISDDLLGLVVEAALFLKRPELLEDAASVIAECLPFSVFKSIGSALTKLDFSDWQQAIESAVQSTRNIHERYKALESLIEGYLDSDSGSVDSETSDSDSGSVDSEASDYDSRDPTNLDLLLESVRESITDLFTSDCNVSRDDGKDLIDIAVTLTYLTTRSILPFVKLHVSNTGFSVAFLTYFFQAGESGWLDTEVVSNVFTDVLHNLLDDFKLEYQVTSNKRARYTKTQSYIRTEVDGDSLATAMAADEIVLLIGCCIRLEENKAINRILRRIRKDATTIDASAFLDLLIPILKGLLRTLPRLGVSLALPQYQAFFQDVLDLYVRRYVGMEPRGGSNWTRSLKGCGCAECCKLDHFLADPDESRATFVLAPARRAHIHQRIGESCEHKTTEINRTPTLVVTKIEDPTQISIRSWLQRRDEAIQIFKELGPRETIQEILGDKYRDLRTFRAVRLSTAASAPL